MTDFKHSWNHCNTLLQEKGTQKGALVKILLPARILKNFIEKKIRVPNINVEISCAVVLDGKSSGECDMIVTKTDVGSNLNILHYTRSVATEEIYYVAYE